MSAMNHIRLTLLTWADWLLPHLPRSMEQRLHPVVAGWRESTTHRLIEEIRQDSSQLRAELRQTRHNIRKLKDRPPSDTDQG